MNRPIERIIESGLIYWIKSQCNSINDLKLNLNILFSSILNYQVNETSLSAKDIIFKDLIIDQLKIYSDSINLTFNPMNNRAKIISIKNDFQITGELLFKDNSLNTIIDSENWSWILSLLKEEFFHRSEFIELITKENILVIKLIDKVTKEPHEKYLQLKVNREQLFFKDQETSKELALPMDENIKITKVILEHGALSVLIESTVRV